MSPNQYLMLAPEKARVRLCEGGVEPPQSKAGYTRKSPNSVNFTVLSTYFLC